MTSKLPGKRLSDVLRQNSKETLERHAAQLATAVASMPPEAVETRFLRNHFLVNPKAMHLLTDAATLERGKVFAVYKPPFCPMRRADAGENYHRVSVESFVTASLRSREVAPVLQRCLPTPADLRVRVLYELGLYDSGPVVVSVADAQPSATSLAGVRMTYELIVAGHLTVSQGGPKRAAVRDFYPAIPTAAASKNNRVSEAALDAAEATVEVKQNAYYCHHPVSHVEVVVTSPPTPNPPDLAHYVREQLHSCVLGDPIAMEDMFNKAGSKTATDDPNKKRRSIVVMRGDCDFPRVFSHLREVELPTVATGFDGGLDAGGGSSAAGQSIVFHCRKCFDPLLQRSCMHSMKAKRMNILDGTWTPESEFL